MTKVIAILCSDIHLSHRPPPARANEPSWYDAMVRPLHELDQLSRRHNVPIICAGDVFDKWNSPPELINFAIEHMPKMHAIPGQHDLPYHSHEDIHKSAYWTLVEAGKIESLSQTKLLSDEVLFSTFSIHSFAWGMDIEPCTLSDDYPEYDGISLAVIHKYCWIKGESYPGAPEENNLGSYRKQLEGYDAAVFGDNHIPFLALSNHCNVINCGGFMRRKADEEHHTPIVGLLYDNASIEQHYLDISKDIFTTDHLDKPIVEPDMREFIEELQDLDSDSLDFTEAVNRYLSSNKISQKVKDLILESLEVTG